MINRHRLFSILSLCSSYPSLSLSLSPVYLLALFTYFLLDLKKKKKKKKKTIQSWGKLGAQRFLDLVDAGLFSTMVALHRAVKGFIIQFGTPGDPAWSAKYKGKVPAIIDDKQWMPIGPSCGAKVNIHIYTEKDL
jgi:hypothetical protein